MKYKIETSVLILIEGKARELESACLLHCELKRRGINSIIRSVYPNREKLPFVIKAKVVVTPWAYNRYDMRYLSCFYRNKNCKIINMHHEQFGGVDGGNTCLPIDDAKDIIHIAWGQQFEDELKKVNCEKDSICRAGNIRLDLYKKKFNGLSKNKKELAEEFDINRHLKWIMFIANGYHLADERKIKNMETIDPKAREKAVICTRIRADFLQYVDRYLSENDDVVFIYRPHPSLEMLEKIQPEIVELSKRYKNRFVCIFKYPIRDWIVNTDASMSIHSTSGIESFVGERPFYLFRTELVPEYLNYSFYLDYKNIIGDYDAFCLAIKHPSCVGEWKSINQYYDISFNKDAYSIIADKIEILLSDNSIQGIASIKNVFMTYMRAYEKDKLIQISKMPLMKAIIERKAKRDIRYQTILPDWHDLFNEEEVEDLEEKINKCIE